jgi:hypothetical protein
MTVGSFWAIELWLWMDSGSPLCSGRNDGRTRGKSNVGPAANLAQDRREPAAELAERLRDYRREVDTDIPFG